jgi:putative intracellular protease/amidase
LPACAAIAGNAQALAVAGQGTWETTLLGRDIYGNAVTQRDSNGLDSSAVFLYDTVLDVTWLRDANYANGTMRWDAANTWASNLTVGEDDGWRLPALATLAMTRPTKWPPFGTELWATRRAR